MSLRSYRYLDQRACARAELLSRVHPLHVVAEIIGAPEITLRRARKRGWSAADKGHPKRPRPTDFAIQARRMNTLQLTRHYAAGWRTVQRWLEELGQ